MQRQFLCGFDHSFSHDFSLSSVDIWAEGLKPWESKNCMIFSQIHDEELLYFVNVLMGYQ